MEFNIECVAILSGFRHPMGMLTCSVICPFSFPTLESIQVGTATGGCLLADADTIDRAVLVRGTDAQVAIRC